MAYEKQYDSALKELKQAQQLLDLHINRAMDHMTADNYRAIITASHTGGVNKLMKMTRSEAEAFTWIYFADKIINSKAAIYEELDLPAKAKPEYGYLCEKLKDPNACNNLERLI